MNFKNLSTTSLAFAFVVLYSQSGFSSASAEPTREEKAVAAVQAVLGDSLPEVAASILASQIVYHTDETTEGYLDPFHKLQRMGWSLHKTTHIESCEFRAQAWRNDGQNKCLIAYRGTDVNPQNILADVSIALRAGAETVTGKEGVLGALLKHGGQMATVNSKHTDEGFGASTWGFFGAAASGLWEVVSARPKTSFALGPATVGAAIATFQSGTSTDILTATASVVSEVADTVQKVSEDYHNKTLDEAKSFAAQILEDIPEGAGLLFTGHPLGGYLAASVAHSNPTSLGAITYNGPGGHADKGIGPHTRVFNIVRESDLVGNVGAAEIGRNQIIIPSSGNRMADVTHSLGFVGSEHGIDGIARDLEAIIQGQL